MNKKIPLNEKGVTLIEILAAITILSIVLIILMNIFPQMGLFNQKNEVKVEAINNVKQLLKDWQNQNKFDEDLKNFPEQIPFIEGIDDSTDTTPYSKIPNDNDDLIIYERTNKKNFREIITILKEPDFKDNSKGIHQINIQILDSSGTIVGESFGYITIFREVM